MAIRSVTQLKSWFRKGLYPTEQQFADLIDSFRHKSELVDVSDISVLADTLNGKYDKSEGDLLSRRVDRYDAALERLTSELEDQRELIRDMTSRLATLESYNQLKILSSAEFAALTVKDNKVLYVVDDEISAANAMSAGDELGLMSVDMEADMDRAYSYMDAMGAVMIPGYYPEMVEPTEDVMVEEVADMGAVTEVIKIENMTDNGDNI